MKTKTTKQRGLSLIELMLGFVIIGGFVIGIYQTFATTDNASKIEAEVKNLQTLQSMIKGAFATAPNFRGITNTMFTRNRAMPERMRAGDPKDGKIRNIWHADGVKVLELTGAATTVGETGKTTKWLDGDKYYIEYPGVPADSCFDLVSKTRRFFDEVRVGKNENGRAVYSVGTANTFCAEKDVSTIYFVGS